MRLFFIDESGSIPKFLDRRYKNRYFVISFVHTNDPKHTSRVYKWAIRQLKKDHQAFFSSLPNPNECKGSDMLPHMKAYVIDKLLTTTDITVGHMVVYNPEIDQRFREKPGRSFNYLIKLIIENFSLSADDISRLELYIDNRNTKLEGLTELEGYLYNELVLDSSIVNDVKVDYLESCDHYNIQIADLIANIVYQRFRYKTLPFPQHSDIADPIDLVHPFTTEHLYNIIKPKLRVAYVFPPRSNIINDAAAGITL